MKWINIKDHWYRPATTETGSPRLVRLAATLAGLSGWRRHGVAALCGVLAAAALPPFHLVPLLVPAFAGLLWLMDGTARRRDAALIGWSFGFGHMLAGLYWIGIAFLVDSARFGLVMPFAMLGLIAGLAFFPALAAFAAGWPGWRGPARVALLATAWLAVEWLRAWVLTGFPWNLIGTVWSFSPAMLQLTALTGVWGLSLMTVLAAAAPAVLVEAGVARPRGRRLFVAAMLLLPALVWGGGALRLAAAPPLGADVVEGVVLRLVQPSIEQALKWKTDLRRDHVARQMRLSAAAGAERVSHVIWAETAVPYLLTQDAELRSLIARVVPEGGLLLAGAPRAGEERGSPRLWNSLRALDGAGEIVGTYDKVHLVPFGEYMPLRSILGFVKLTAGSVDFSPGPGPIALSLSGLPDFAPLICYEAIFPGRVVAAGTRPEWLLNVTNDAWFGTSSGPFQHFASARIRAVEEGLPLVRVAKNGITGVVDAYGRIVGRLGLNEIGILDSPLPRPADGGSLYARFGDWMAFMVALAVGFSALILRRFVA
jgi:apolipoprotein N-acyltransferase